MNSKPVKPKKGTFFVPHLKKGTFFLPHRKKVPFSVFSSQAQKRYLFRSGPERNLFRCFPSLFLCLPSLSSRKKYFFRSAQEKDTCFGVFQASQAQKMYLFRSGPEKVPFSVFSKPFRPKKYLFRSGLKKVPFSEFSKPLDRKKLVFSFRTGKRYLCRCFPFFVPDRKKLFPCFPSLSSPQKRYLFLCFPSLSSPVFRASQAQSRHSSVVAHMLECGRPVFQSHPNRSEPRTEPHANRTARTARPVPTGSREPIRTEPNRENPAFRTDKELLTNVA